MKASEITVVFISLMVLTVVAVGKYDVALIKEKVVAHHHVMSGKAQYLPGKVCIIDTSPETVTADVVMYARACAKAHEEWLDTPKENEE